MKRFFPSKAERESWFADCEMQVYAWEWKGSFTRQVELTDIPFEDLVGPIE